MSTRPRPDEPPPPLADPRLAQALRALAAVLLDIAGNPRSVAPVTAAPVTPAAVVAGVSEIEAAAGEALGAGGHR
jgi:hypothetical protein